MVIGKSNQASRIAPKNTAQTITINSLKINSTKRIKKLINRPERVVSWNIGLNIDFNQIFKAATRSIPINDSLAQPKTRKKPAVYHQTGK